MTVLLTYGKSLFMKKLLMIIMNFFVLSSIAAASVECPHICSDNNCKLIKELSEEEVSKILISNESLLNAFKLNSSHIKKVRIIESETCSIEYNYKGTLLSFDIGSWYEESREFYNYRALDQNEECQRVAQSYNDGSDIITSTQYLSAQQLLDKYTNGQAHSKIFLYELPSGEKVFWVHETIYDISSGLPAGKMEKIFSVEKSTFHGDYLLDFNADGYQFCWYH